MSKIAPTTTPIVVLISGRGSNLQSIINATRDAEWNAGIDIKAVISNRPAAAGLTKAAAANIECIALDHTRYSDRNAFDRELIRLIEVYRPALVVLAGYMRILSDEFVDHFSGRLLNIHPALLPKFRGLNTHQRAIDAGETEHGASVHLVSRELDSGAVIMQARVPVLAGDDADTLATRVLEQEHRIYPLVLQWFAQRRLAAVGDGVSLDGKLLNEPVIFNETLLTSVDA